MISFVLACLGGSFLTAAAATAVMRVVAPRVGLVDAPDAARKVHTTPTPLGGGVAVHLGVVLPLVGAVLLAEGVLTGWVPEALVPAELLPHAGGVDAKLGTLGAVLLAATVLAAVGLWDDLRPVGWGWRLAVQFVCAAAVVACGVRFTLFLPGWAGAAVGAAGTVLWLAVLTNAFNFLDNMNGLTTGTAAVASGLLAAIMLLALPEPHWFVAAVALVLCGSLLGFLAHNWGGHIFLGDAGSTFAGFTLAAACVLGTFYETGADDGPGGPAGRHVLLAPLCLLAVPLYDFVSVVTLRLSRGLSPFHADRNHFSHRLTDRGLTKKGAVRTVWLCTAVTGLAGLTLYRVDGWVGAGLLLAVVVGVLLVVAVLEFSGSPRAAGDGGLEPPVLRPASPPGLSDTDQADAVGPSATIDFDRPGGPAATIDYEANPR